MYDLLVIGAGPAGSAAAYHASTRGCRVLLIDRVPFPRPKTCGDALTPRALAATQRMGIAALPGRPVGSIQIVHAERMRTWTQVLRDHAAPHTGLVIPREQLDHLLLERARAAGARFEVGHAEGLVWRRGRVRGAVVQTSRGRLHIDADAVVLATGAGASSGLVAGVAAARPPVWGVAARTYLEVGEDPGHELRIHLPLTAAGGVLAGYAWIFPAGPGRVNVGVGVIPRPGAPAPSVRGVLERFLARAAEDGLLPSAVRCAPVRSAPLAFGAVLPDVPGLVLAGDRAGLVSPLTGEGIAQALESGELVGSALQEGLGDLSRRYAARFHESFPQQLTIGPTLPHVSRCAALLLDRACDVFSGSSTTLGAAVERVLCDRVSQRPYGAGHEGRSLDDTLTTVRREVLRAAGRRRLLATLIQELTEDHRVSFGWYAVFGEAVHRGVASPAARLPANASPILAVLELLHLTTVLARDMLPEQLDPLAEATWGRNAGAVAVIDCLTAHALRLLHGLPGRWTAAVARAARQTLQLEVAARLTGRVAPPARARALFVLASRAAASLAIRAPVPEPILAATELVAAMRDGAAVDRSRHLAEAKRILGDAPGPVAVELGAALELLARGGARHAARPQAAA